MISQSAALKPGTHIGDLQVNAILGVGSSGITYLATDPAIGTRFALKEYLPSRHVNRDDDGKVRPKNDSSEQIFKNGLKQFLNEAQTVAALDHPNVVKILRYFEANGTAYYLMPYYQGQALHHRLESDGKFSRDDAKALMLPLMGALEYIHNHGIIHQDINPANIYMTQNGDPVLLDFARAAMGANDDPAEQIFGSTAYTAPEQTDTGGTIGPWTDIYSLAATIYRCVTGSVPVAAAERQLQLDAGKPDPLTAFSDLASPGQFGGLTDAVELGLNLSPGERPRDVGQWRKSFESLDWHRSVVVGGSTESYAKERNEWLPIALLAIFILTMTAIGIFLLTDESPETPLASRLEPTSAGADEPTAGKPVTPERTSSSAERKRWEAALQADTLLGYRRFIEDFPESIYRQQAEIQLAILDEKAWQELSLENSIPAYEDYLEMFPNGIHQAEAMQRIDMIKQVLARIERIRIERERREAGLRRVQKHVDQHLRKLSMAVEQSPNIVLITDTNSIIELVVFDKQK